MLNLSDKELDRLSREAANQHEPGDQLGPRSWDRLEFRLDKELGRLGPNPLRGIRSVRRIPFYYAPAILLLVGVSYYFIKQGKGNTAKTEPPGGPPMTVVKPLSPTPSNPDSLTKTLENSPNSTRPDKELSAQYPTTAPGTGTIPPAGASEGSKESASAKGTTTPSAAPPNTGAGTAHAIPTPGTSGTSTASTSPASMAPKPYSPKPSTVLPGSTSHHGSVTPHTNTLPESTGSKEGSTTSTESTTGSASASSRPISGRSHGRTHRSGYHPNEEGYAETGQLTTPSASQLTKPSAGQLTRPSKDSKDPGNPKAVGQTGDQEYASGSDPKKGLISKDNNVTVAASLRKPGFSLIQAPHSLARSGNIDDSALRAFAVKGAPVATPIRLGKKKNASLHVDRPLAFGLSLAPDFASVHSMAGDKPGSSIGLTIDYQILNRLHINTGLLLTRKNYAATPQNYHVPKDYYRMINPMVHDVNLIKGSFNMLEIPLNLRYDIHASGNTVFFISGGASSYLMTSENSQYYYSSFGRQDCQNFNPVAEAQHKNYLFASVDLSMGVETGISNSLSLLIAPYVKMPTRGIGFGQVQMTSVGLDFTLKLAPVLNRKRK